MGLSAIKKQRVEYKKKVLDTISMLILLTIDPNMKQLLDELYKKIKDIPDKVVYDDDNHFKFSCSGTIFGWRKRIKFIDITDISDMIQKVDDVYTTKYKKEHRVQNLKKILNN